jgi:bidirectional [NiFe] hydrogenase diaphorase subunit
MVNFKINGTDAQVAEDVSILQAARGMGIKIPTLCHHEALTPYGSCRLCIVEVVKKGRGKIVTSCNHPVEEGAEVFTHSEKVLTHRKMLMELLLARCPDVGIIRDMAGAMGITTSRFPESRHDCILCGLCVRVCDEKIGASAISFVNRGVDEDVSAPFDISSEACIGCGACASVCPTGAIAMEDIRDLRRIRRFHTAKQLHQCPSCGRHYATELQLEWIEERLGPQAVVTGLCTECRRVENARVARIAHALRHTDARDGKNGAQKAF